MREQDPETRIITMDDDMVYSDDVIEVLLSANTDDRVVGIMGTISVATASKGFFIHSEQFPNGSTPVDQLGGYRGICYRRGLIEDDIYSDFDKICEFLGDMLLDDDAFFADYLKNKGVQTYVVGGVKRKNGGVLGYLNFENALSPKGSGINQDAGGATKRDMSVYKEAIFRHFNKAAYERDVRAAEYHIRGDNFYYGNDCEVNKARALELWADGANKGNRQCLKNLLWALEDWNK
jgi:hypothetical protein